jgi:hypothetical protein
VGDTGADFSGSIALPPISETERGGDTEVCTEGGKREVNVFGSKDGERCMQEAPMRPGPFPRIHLDTAHTPARALFVKVRSPPRLPRAGAPTTRGLRW